MSSNYEEHLILVRKVLQTLAKFNMKIKVAKSEFFKHETKLLGHIMSRDGIRKSPEYIEKVKNHPPPVTVTDLRKFLGLVNFQRKFIPRCSEICKPLSEITGGNKKTKINWTPERLEAFNRLKEEIGREVLLSYPDYSENSKKLQLYVCLLYTSPSPRDKRQSRMPSSA